MATPDCPCGSGLRLKACCARFFDGAIEPPDAETLMRSRYSAFALGEVEHLWRTLDVTHPDRAEPKDALLLALRRMSRTSRWRGLVVLDRAPPDATGLARVLFLARIFQAGRDASFLECSEFRHEGHGWRYLRGESRPLAAVPGDPLALRIASF
jgi:SEC-C motif-containing protein